ncbi:RNA polymerase sigma factor [Desulfovibrio inopinatus]|uniref:RNA polymerase sigma factor n=1 Tax=Desulfovibrio inopinatus TaxID=102109 RepID=UPI00041824A3|nr:sigma-70 family RNA polymerase sigma factor [Desulfovibrio inopinatus]
MPPKQIDEATLVQSAQNGDAAAFTELVKSNQQHVAAVCAGHVPFDKVEEVAQEAFVRAYQSLNRFRGDAPFRNWLSVLAVRSCHDYWRKSYRNKEHPASTLGSDDEHFLERIADTGPTLEEEAEKRQAIRLLHYALDGLSPTDRMVVTLTHLEEYTVAETAKILDLSVANVKVRAFRARKKLRKLLAELDPAA